MVSYFMNLALKNWFWKINIGKVIIPMMILIVWKSLKKWSNKHLTHLRLQKSLTKKHSTQWSHSALNTKTYFPKLGSLLWKRKQRILSPILISKGKLNRYRDWTERIICHNPKSPSQTKTPNELTSCQNPTSFLMI